MAFRHPKSRKEHYRNDDKPNTGGVPWNFFKRTINIPKYRNAKDDVNPAKNRTLVASFMISLSSIDRRYRVIYSGLPLMRLFLARAPRTSMVLNGEPMRASSLDSRLLSRLRRPVGRFNPELLGAGGPSFAPFARMVIPDSRSIPVLLTPPSPTLSQRTRKDGPVARSVGASPAAPLGGVRQHEQVQTGEQERGEGEHRQEAQPRVILPLYHDDDVDDDGHRKGNRQPAVGLPNPFVPVQCDLL